MAAILLAALLAPAQNQATARITVVDPSGAVIVGAEVSILTADGVTASAISDLRGEARFAQLPPGRYATRTEAAGFQTAEIRDWRIREGENRRTVRLSIAKIAETVIVGRDPRERASDPRGDRFTTILTPAQIAELPDDPDELERVLNEMAGSGATFRVNGFRSTRLPSKDQIQQVRFRRNVFAADTHEAGGVLVDIVTRPGGETWRGTTGSAFRSSTLNARNALAQQKDDSRLHRYSFTLNGPLWKQHTSASLSVESTSAVDARPIVARPPSVQVPALAQQSLDARTMTLRAEHALSKAHVLRLEADLNTGGVEHAGVGDFDLPEREYAQSNDGHTLRASTVGPIGRAVFNEFRIQSQSNEISYAPLATAPAVLVLNTFNSGGAQISGGRQSSYFELGDDVDIARGHHALRGGFLIERNAIDSNVSRNAGGTFTFASLDAYQQGQATTYARNVGDPRVKVILTQAAIYLQDDVRVRKNLTLSIGAREEHQSLIGGWQFGPRAAAAWSPFASGQTSVRLGAGVFFDWFDARNYEDVVQLDGTHQHIETIVQPSYPVVDSRPAQLLPPGRMRFGAALHQPRVAQALLAVEQVVGGDVRISVSLSAGRSRDIFRGINVNAPVAGVRPDASSGPIIEIAPLARAERGAVSIQTTYSPNQRPLFVTTNYTFARSNNDTDGPAALPANAYDLAAEWGAASDDVRHRFTALFSTPVVGRLRFGVFGRVQSGAPYNITTGRDDNGDTISNDRPGGVPRNSARGKMQGEVSARLSWTIGFIRRPSTGGGPTALPRTKGDGDALAALGGAVDLTKRYNVEISAQAFNLLNRVNATAYSGVLTSPWFGRPIAVAVPRRFELGARLRF